MDNLTKDVLAAERAGMSYGKWRASHPHTRPDPNRHTPRQPVGPRTGLCKICGSTFEYSGPTRVTCSEKCRGELHRLNNRNYRARKRGYA